MGRSADTSQGPPASHKTTRPAFSLPTQAGAHHTSCAHRRLPPALPPSPSSWPSSPSLADSQERAGLHERWRKLGYESGRGWWRCWTGVPPNLRVCESGVCPTGSWQKVGAHRRSRVHHLECTSRAPWQRVCRSQRCQPGRTTITPAGALDLRASAELCVISSGSGDRSRGGRQSQSRRWEVLLNTGNTSVCAGVVELAVGRLRSHS